jgi:hypothetical protein
MFLKRLLWTVPIILCASLSAKADITPTVYFNGGYAFADNGYGIPPYEGTLNGQSTEFFCVDFAHDITDHTGWEVTITDLANPTGYGSTRMGSQATYLDMAWLVTKMMGAGDQTTKAEYQWAIWSLSGGVDPYGQNGTYGALSLLQDAQNAVSGGFTGQGWEILTPTGTYGQEFLVTTPEPPGLFLLGAGLATLLGVRRRATACPHRDAVATRT